MTSRNKVKSYVNRLQCSYQFELSKKWTCRSMNVYIFVIADKRAVCFREAKKSINQLTWNGLRNIVKHIQCFDNQYFHIFCCVTRIRQIHFVAIDRTFRFRFACRVRFRFVLLFALLFFFFMGGSITKGDDFRKVLLARDFRNRLQWTTRDKIRRSFMFGQLA